VLIAVALIVTPRQVMSAERVLPREPDEPMGHEATDLDDEVDEYMPPGQLARMAAGRPDQQPLGYQPSMPFGAYSGLAWTFLGPRPIQSEFWSGGADAGGRVSALVAVDSSVVYIAAAQGGVWKSVDAGTTWMPLTDQLSSLASGALALDPVDPNILYYGTGEQHYSKNSFYGDGLFETNDGGATWWKLATKGSVGNYIARIVVEPTNRDVIFVASDRGVVRSTDRGVTWSVVLGVDWANDLAIVPNSQTVYAAIFGHGIYRSDDDGVTWAQLGGGLPTTNLHRINFALAPSNPSVLYAAFVAASTFRLLGMYRTSDGGANWSLLPNTPDYMGAPNYGGQGYYDNTVVVDPADANTCYAGGLFPYGNASPPPPAVIKTVDGGASWTDITYGVDFAHPHPDTQLLTFGPDRTLWVANDGGVWKSSDQGSHWINCNHDLGIAQFFTAALHPTNADFILGGTQDNGALKYGGNLGWPQTNAGDGSTSAINPVNTNVYYTSYIYLDYIYRWDTGILKKTIQGPWTTSPDRQSNPPRIHRGNPPLLVDPGSNNGSTVLVGTYRVWKSTNNGNTWNALSGDQAPPDGHLRAIALVNSTTMYTASSNGLVYVTTNGGTSWTSRSAGLPPRPLPDLFVDPSNSQWLYTCVDSTSGDRVFSSLDGGVTWTSVTGDLPIGLRALSLAVDFRMTPRRLYLGTDYGLYYSGDFGGHWLKSAGNLPNCAVLDLAIDTVHDRIQATTHGRGQWMSALDVFPPLVTVGSPNGGESWRVGSTHSIFWNAIDERGVQSVNLLLSTGGLYSPIATGLTNTGSYTWTVPNSISSTCRVKAEAVDGAGNVGSDVSDAVFTIWGQSGAMNPVALASTTPHRLALQPVSPNPARAPVSMGFELPSRMHVSLALYDALGRRTKVLEDGFAEPGEHVVRWDGRDDSGRLAGDGVYFLRLRAGDSELNRRIALVQ